MTALVRLSVILTLRKTKVGGAESLPTPNLKGREIRGCRSCLSRPRGSRRLELEHMLAGYCPRTLTGHCMQYSIRIMSRACSRCTTETKSPLHSRTTDQSIVTCIEDRDNPSHSRVTIRLPPRNLLSSTADADLNPESAQARGSDRSNRASGTTTRPVPWN